MAEGNVEMRERVRKDDKYVLDGFPEGKSDESASVGDHGELPLSLRGPIPSQESRAWLASRRGAHKQRDQTQLRIYVM